MLGKLNRHDLNQMTKVNINNNTEQGHLVAQLSIRLLTSAQVMISWFVSSSPILGSVLTVQNLLGILSLSLSAPPPLIHALSLSQNKY